jgi:hypothetical protein
MIHLSLRGEIRTGGDLSKISAEDLGTRRIEKEGAIQYKLQKEEAPQQKAVRMRNFP